MDQTVRKHDAAELFRLLDEQAALFEQWLTLDDKKRNALLGMDREQLEETVGQQTDVLIRLDDAEKRRRECIALLCPDNPNATLREMADRLSHEARQALLSREAKLESVLQRAAESNQLSEALLQQAVAHNQVVLDALLGGTDVPATYGPPGQGAYGTKSAHRIGTKARRINQQA